ncbi:MAG: Glycosyl transferase, group 1 [Parcubacteria group bacterium GW2011_GWA1_42_7]|nr:MAG: Glycosyl transferase, group 1 [Parcubacteria group bacterium GW2011_GWA1_42_7]
MDYLPIPSDFNKEFFKKQNNLKEKVILTVCRMIPGKGVEKILEILPDLKKDFPEISFVGLGGGPELEKLAGKSRELKNRFGVDARFLGDLPRNEDEGMAHTLLEAAYLGTPVATTGAGGNPEIIEDGHTGLVFDFNDGEQIKSALKKILFDNDLAEKLAANAGEKLKSNFSWKKAVEANLRILKY